MSPSSAIKVSAFQTQDPLHLHYFLFAMVDFHDPVVVDRDSRAYRFGAFSGNEEHIDFFFILTSCTLKALARCGWPLSVSLLGAVLFLLQNTTNSKGYFTAGSSSRISTMSGVSSKDVAVIGGRSVYVVTAPSFKNPCILGGRRAVFLFFFVDILLCARGSSRRCNNETSSSRHPSTRV